MPVSAPRFEGSASDDRYRLGRRAVRWIEANCRYGQGDRFGQPVRLEPWQVLIILQIFELLPSGRRRRRRVLIEVPKGNGKTPIAAWVGAFELAHRASPVIPVGAASYDQADLLFGDFRDCVRESPTLGAVFEAFENEVQRVDGSGSAYKVAAVAGTNDGKRPTVFLADEIHEWTGNKERVHLVIANGLSKRLDSLNLNTTTPGWDKSTLAGRLHDYGVRVNDGEIVDDEFLFIWYGCDPATVDFDDPESVRAAVLRANPAAGVFLYTADVVARCYQIPRHEFIRYHLGWWTESQQGWLPPGAWGACAGEGDPAPGTQVVLGFDGSRTGDSTGIVGCTVSDTPHLFVVKAWESDPRVTDWSVPIVEVEDEIRAACAKWDVVEIIADKYLWERSLQLLAADGLPVVEFPQNMARMAPATQLFYESVINNRVTHTGDPALARHVSNAVLKEDSRGSRIVKDSKMSTRRIDLAVCSVMALSRAVWWSVERPPSEIAVAGVWA